MPALSMAMPRSVAHCDPTPPAQGRASLCRAGHATVHRALASSSRRLCDQAGVRFDLIDSDRLCDPRPAVVGLSPVTITTLTAVARRWFESLHEWSADCMRHQKSNQASLDATKTTVAPPPHFLRGTRYPASMPSASRCRGADINGRPSPYPVTPCPLTASKRSTPRS